MCCGDGGGGGGGEDEDVVPKNIGTEMSTIYNLFIAMVEPEKLSSTHPAITAWHATDYWASHSTRIETRIQIN